MIKPSLSLLMISRGFTLIEITVVLFIIGLLLAGLLTPLMTVVEQRDRQKTIDILADIQENLLGYALVHGRLPCPDQDEDGVEDRKDDEDGKLLENGGPLKRCKDESGELPWVTLGLAAQQDAWRRPFIYQVDGRFADDESCDNNTVISFCLSDNGNINIKDIAGDKLVTHPVPVIIVSTGRHDNDTLADLSDAEQENKDKDADFIAADYSQQQGAEFDDILIWITPTVLMYQMVQAGRLP